MDINNLKRQHAEILSIAADINKLLTVEDLREKAFEAAMALGKLSGKVSIHLNTEDKFLYPKLRRHPDKRVRSVAGQFINEMEGISKAFMGYKTKYLSAGKIKNDPEGFIEETKTIFTALKERIRLEEKELYKLL